MLVIMNDPLHNIKNTEFNMFFLWIGFGTLYGDNDLRDRMDPASIMRTVESTLWNHFDRYVYVSLFRHTKML